MDETYKVRAIIEYYVNATSKDEALNLVMENGTFDECKVIYYSATRVEEDE